MKTLTLIIFMIATNYSYSQDVAITIDDSPMASSLKFNGPQRANKIISALKKHKIKSVFFSNSGKFVEDEQRQRLIKYSIAGHYIANHTHSHNHASQLGADKYIQDIQEAEGKLSFLKTYEKWFRFPFLDEGKDHNTRDQIFNWLEINNYKIGYVTIDTFDWYINSLYQTALSDNKKIDYKKLKESYVKYILDCSKIFQEKSLLIYKTPIKHTLLIHENDLTALFLDDMISAYKKLGWNVIDPKIAIEQHAFQVKLNTLKNNDGLIIAKESLTNPKAQTIELNSYDYKYLDSEFQFLR